jgi:hypothetical protein
VKEFFKDLFTTYGSFATLILLGLGYFIKRKYDLKSRKIETKYALESKKIENNYFFFQEGRIKAISRFFDNYSKVERMWHSFSIHKVIERELSASELDNVVWTSMNPLKKYL